MAFMMPFNDAMMRKSYESLLYIYVVIWLTRCQGKWLMEFLASCHGHDCSRHLMDCCCDLDGVCVTCNDAMRRNSHGSLYIYVLVWFTRCQGKWLMSVLPSCHGHDVQ